MVKGLFDNDFFVTKIVLACFVKAGSGVLLHRNRPSHGFAYHISGEKIYRFADGASLRVKDGDLIYLPQFSDYIVDDVVKGDCYAINFLLDTTCQTKPFKVNIKSDNILQSFKRAERCFQLQQYGYKEKCCKELYEIACFIKQKLYEQKYTSKKQLEILKRAEEYIATRYTTEKISLCNLSEYCGVSEVYLRKIFKSKYNISPINYINNAKLSYANALLLSGEYSVTDACFLSGFNDTSYFCRIYKNKYGFSPKNVNKTKEAVP